MDSLDEVAAVPEYGPPPQYPIESVDNALKLLVLLGQRSTIRLTDVSQFLGVASSSAHRMLAMLQYRGFVRQDAVTRSYAPGPALDELAFTALRQHDVRNQARPVLERLNVELRETVHLGQLENSDVRFIDSIESSQALRVASRVGRTMPAHCTSTGKALLATLSDEQVRELYPEEKLFQLTQHSVATRTQLLEELAEIRRRGYAVSQEESEEGVSSVAIAIPKERSPRLALNASVPRSRMTAATLRRIRQQLLAAADDIAVRLV
jgi:DNA-binding IclR family transcriptional regulator